MSQQTEVCNEESFVELDEGCLAYIDRGSGPVLVFIHGWPLNRKTFLPLIERLETDFRCVAFDLLDIGNSRPVAKGVELSFRRHAAIILEALDRLDIDRFSLIGQDSGGLIARMMADAGRARVDQLLLFNTELPDHIPPWLRLFQALAKVPPLAKATVRMSIGSRTLAKGPMAFGGCFADKEKIFGRFYDDCARPLLDDDEKLSGTLRFLGLMDWSERFEIEAMHRRITAQTHFVWGEDDQFFPLKLGRQAFEQFPNRGQFIVMEDTKLLPYYEQPDLATEHIKNCLGLS